MPEKYLFVIDFVIFMLYNVSENFEVELRNYGGPGSGIYCK